MTAEFPGRSRYAENAYPRPEEAKFQSGAEQTSAGYGGGGAKTEEPAGKTAGGISKNFVSLAAIAFCIPATPSVSAYAAAPAQETRSAQGRISNPITLYAVADAHVGLSGRGERMMAFAETCNAEKPDIILDLGDAIHAETTGFYNYETHGEAALKQQRDWLEAWEAITAGRKAVALGNRDVLPADRPDRHTLSEKQWVRALGYDDRPEIGGTKLQESFTAENGEVEALVVIICTYPGSYDRTETLKWIEEEVTAFNGDFIVFASHHVGMYKPVLNILKSTGVDTPALYLHGHNHGPDTLVRDAWGRECDERNFPVYLVTDLARNPVAAKFRLHGDGYYEKFRLDVVTGEVSEPVMHFQTRVRER